MIDTTTYLMFLSAGAVIVLAPGPAQALTLARSISNGRKAGIMTALGLNINTIVHALAAGTLSRRITGSDRMMVCVLLGLGIRLALSQSE